ncbi:MAG: DUF4837 family protein [Candidatus Glassbacteria bacterium]|nr:DUF4837 family protein [Candidatus Glassbacteria bacterium]
MEGSGNGFLTAALSVLLSVLLLPAACGELDWNKPQAFGRQKEILVICDDNLWEQIEQPLRRQVERQLHAVRRERIFEIAQVSAEKVRHYKEWDKIILIESLENARLISFVVADSTMARLRQGEGLFFNQIDVWADGQRVVGLAAPADEDIPRLVVAHGEKIFNAFIRQVEAQEMSRMYHSGRDTLLADSLAVAQGFSIELPNVYAQIRQDSLAENELLFVHMKPVRSVFITWEENAAQLEKSQPALAANRSRLLEFIYPSQATLVERVDTSTVVANGLERLRVYGVWENREEISGGIYVSHLIESPEQKRRYYIDGLLFCPDLRRNKYRYLFQLDEILNTFQLHPDHKAPAQGRPRSK